MNTNMERSTPRVLVTYETPELKDGWQDEYAESVPDIGHGVIAEGGRRWRVVDVWHSYDKHSPVDYGTHVYLEPVLPGSADDRPGRIDPKYFRNH